jgi:7-keto-8-aminopelargonate synthetase-like enzyme
MASHSEQLDVVFNIAEELVKRGIILRTAEDPTLNGRTVLIDGKPRINFGSCSYLGLELDSRVRAGAIDAIERYGTQFSSSRSYISAPLYRELESLLDQLFGGFTVITPNTTLAHLSALPVLVHEDDAVILDHQVHFTVRMAADLLRPHGVEIQVLRHSDMNRLETLVKELSASHRCVWYLADGVYSMHGDVAPLGELEELLNRHESLRLYVDDAHGMGWCGRNGRGYALSVIPRHPRMVVATSLNKCFGAAGGALILPDEVSRRRVNLIAGPMIFTGPLQPPSLGAAVASAQILLSPEIEVLQRRLRERIHLFNRLADEHDLPLVGFDDAPIRFVGMGWPKVAMDMTKRLLDQGFWTNLASFPAVVAKRSGVRSTITLHQSADDIRRLVEATARHMPDALAREGSSMEEVHSLFKLAPASGSGADGQQATSATPGALYCQHERTIEAIDAAEWDRCFAARGSFAADGLRLLEKTFRESTRPEDNWSFHYWIVRDRSHRPVLATFFTEALWKDDILSPANVSERVEELRAEDPYFLTSRVLSMGSLLTEGDHLYLDRTADWRGAMTLLLSAVTETADNCGAKQVALRDLPANDPAMDRHLGDLGFVKLSTGDSLVLEIHWSSDEEYLRRLKRSHRRFQRKEVLPWEDAYEVEVLRHGGRVPGEEEWAHLHGLYRNVRERSLELNTFELPERLLREMLARPEWELVTLRLKPERGGRPEGPPDGFLAGYIGREHYVFLLCGLDYRLVRSHRLYRRCLWECIRRAQAHGCQRLLFGMGSEQVKRCFGAERQKRAIYLRSDDLFSADVLDQIEADLATRRSGTSAG